MALPLPVLRLIAEAKSVSIVTDNAVAPAIPVSNASVKVLRRHRSSPPIVAPSCRWSSSSPSPCRWTSSDGKENTNASQKSPSVTPLKGRISCSSSLPRKPERTLANPDEKLSPTSPMSIQSLYKANHLTIQNIPSPSSSPRPRRNSLANSTIILSEALVTALSF